MKQMEQKSNAYLETSSIGSLMRKYAIPCIISLLVASLYNVVDQLFIANASYLGSYGNAANTVVFPLTMVALAIATMIGDGCCTFVSISLGAGKKEDAHRGVGNSIIWIVCIGIILMAVYLIFQEQIITMFGGRVNDETFRLSKEYFFWISLGIPFYMFGQALNPIIRSDGSPRFAMITLLTGAFLNVIFDPICIYVLKWGMMGAAVATIFGQIVSAIMSFFYLFKMKSVSLNRQSFASRLDLMRKIIPMGATSFLTQISVVLSMAAVLNMLTKYGSMDAIFGLEEYSHIPTAVVGIVMKFFQIIISISIGLAAGCIPIVGYNIGAGRKDRVLELMKKLLLTEAIVGLIATIIFEGFPMVFVNLFGAKNESVYYTDFAVRCIRIFLSMLILSCVNKGATIFLQSLGKAKESTLLSVIREIIFGVGLPILLPIVWGLNGILFFMPLADILTTIIAFFVILKTGRMLAAHEEQEYAEAEEPQTAKSDRMPQTQYIITIGRAYGAGGRSIGKMVAERLDIPYYDSELLEKAAQESGLDRKFLQSMDEKPFDNHALYCSVGFGTNAYSRIAEQAITAQTEIIETIASEGPCVIVGRSADLVLAGKYKLLRTFIMSGMENRIKRIQQRDRLSADEAKKKIIKVDKERAAYYNQRARTKWGASESYDLLLNTDFFSLECGADIIADIARKEQE